VLKFVKGPAVRTIFEDASNDPIADRFDIKDGEVLRSFFVGVFDGEARAVAFETFGKGGYGGEVGLMVGIDIKDDKLIGVGVTTHAETPGMGARAETDPSFVSQFKELSLEEPFKVTQDGGSINAISGATLTSRAVSSAATDASKIYQQLKPQIVEKIKEFEK
jgi:electron transport complex protein RnfG